MTRTCACKRSAGDGQSRESAKKGTSSAPIPPAPAEDGSKQKTKRKRRFPYRKVEDLEADIAVAETRLRDLENQLASPDLYREGEKVKETMQAFADVKETLKNLYEHWEEAVEIN